jgi:hypothetical protein
MRKQGFEGKLKALCGHNPEYFDHDR